MRKSSALPVPSVRHQIWFFISCTVLFPLVRKSVYLPPVSYRQQLGSRIPVEEAVRMIQPTSSTPSCTTEQLKAIDRALPDTNHACRDDVVPWYNKCPISQITGCPDLSWIDEYYQKLEALATPFVAINVGCNKGFDAINLLRMGTNDEKVNKEMWQRAMPEMAEGVCKQESDEYKILSGTKPQASATVYCIEPMPATYMALQQAQAKTQLHQLHVLQYAVNNEAPNSTLFPSPTFGMVNGSTNVGAEKQGVGGCYSKIAARQERLQKSCEPVPTTTLDLLSQDQADLRTAPRIHILLIDVEGYDFEVLQGGVDTLKRTELLLFEYNWKGMWGQDKGKQPLRRAIEMMDRLEYSCYFPGNKRNQLWRITNCMLPHYDGLFWANVVCVNRQLVPDLAQRMESLYLKTIE